MPTTNETPLSANPASARWVWVVRAAAIIPFLLFVDFAMRTYFPRGGCAESPTELGALTFYTSPYWSPYLYVLWRLRRGADKRGLQWAMDWGALFCVLTTVLLVSAIEGAPDSMLIGLGSLAVSDAAMAASAVKVSRARLAENPGWPSPPRGYVPVIAYLVLMYAAVAVPNLLRVGRGHNQAYAVGSLRTINAAEATYSETYKTGFSPNLTVLQSGLTGAPPSATQAGSIDPVLGSGKKAGYTFVYLPGPKNQAGQIVSYTVVARPLDDTCGNRSFFTDESGVIRQTEANRAATVKDPALN